jgi:uncharacterized protein YggE
MDEPALASVRGEAVVEVDPETATLDVAVGARDKDRDRALALLDQRSDAVLAVVGSFGSAVERVATAGVRIGPELKDGRGHERIAGYAATIRHAVTVVDFASLGDLLARLAELDMVDVAGPWWRLRPDSPVHASARMDAARAAVARAVEYAEALGSRVLSLVEIADTGLMSEAVPAPGSYPMAPMAAPMAAPMSAPGRVGGGGGGAPVSFDVEPIRQVVRANVEARFRIAQPSPDRLV